MNFISGVYKESAKTIWNLIQGWNYFLKHEVVVGITEDANVGRENGMSNAGLLYMHEQGVPSHNIPPRPVLRPAINDPTTKMQIETLMKDAARAALVEGKHDVCAQNFERAGMIGRDACKRWISDGGHLAPNAPATIEKKGSSKPLVDTGSMLGSITYAVRKK